MVIPAQSIHDRRMKNHTRRPRAEYETVLTRRREEGLTYAAISAESGIPACTLQYWARKLKGPKPTKVSDGDTGAFLQVGLTPATDAAIELVMPGDVRVAIRPGFDAATLRAVVDAFAC